ncbi:hypothetical protein H9Q69_011061 [Fusarium xylarioides]|uniref:Uncharacterized protein n=1 Tax=Fusarium xylarioides TaxID=221167 RepID=A0A9P7L107_9HYPO|nr:hypothetical protein H9Q70_012058 [Fusarium xylarioides]KAG5759911.1 hypothetical protein H9Q72_011972 [Fusarium xylarioides]KAG5789884.1 hypothetical protein H9Q69_011061 [Fusarium xylarioides]
MFLRGRHCRNRWDPIQGKNHTPNPNPSTSQLPLVPPSTINGQLHSSPNAPIDHIPHSLLFGAQHTPVDFCHASAFALIATTFAIFERYARSPATPLAPTLQPQPQRTRSPSCLPIEGTVTLRKATSSTTGLRSIGDRSRFSKEVDIAVPSYIISFIRGRLCRPSCVNPVPPSITPTSSTSSPNLDLILNLNLRRTIDLAAPSLSRDR